MKRRYRMWTPKRKGEDVRTVVTTIPYEVVVREAESLGLQVSEFVEQYEVEILYDSFEGLHIRFVRKETS